jgi:hypothetical protein
LSAPLADEVSNTDANSKLEAGESPRRSEKHTTSEPLADKESTTETAPNVQMMETPHVMPPGESVNPSPPSSAMTPAVDAKKEGNTASVEIFHSKRIGMPLPSRRQAPLRDEEDDTETSPDVTPKKPKTEDEILDAIIELQTFSGSWAFSQELFDLMEITGGDDPRAVMVELGVGEEVIATAFVVAFLEGRMEKKRSVWELVVEKAREWLTEQGFTSSSVAGEMTASFFAQVENR